MRRRRGQRRKGRGERIRRGFPVIHFHQNFYPKSLQKERKRRRKMRNREEK
jgi:hypothetical protein